MLPAVTDISKLRGGDEHYMAYVGPPLQYDFMGATQFRLLTTLGLRSHHTLLDFGCGSLRAGRLFIVYLDEGRYFGIEPNKWLIEEAIGNQVGQDMIALKKPCFDHNADFKTNVFSRRFDYIVAQSILTHTGKEIIRTALRNFKESLKPDGLIVATFKEETKDFDGSGWVYPKVVRYRPSTIKRLAKEAGLFVQRLPWFHPRQTWYFFTTEKRRLPNRAMLRHLSGAVLYDPEFAASWSRPEVLKAAFAKLLIRTLPQPVKDILRKMIEKKADIP